jgi:hypothetical protein
VGKRKRGNIGGLGKEAAFALVERGGKVRSFHVPEVSGKTLRAILFEGYFSIRKRGIICTYHHVSQQHLKRYLAEFDFR